MTDLLNHQHAHNFNFDFDFEEDDAESLASLDSDDANISTIECIIAEFKGKHNHTWYLVKWIDCPAIRSSWECSSLFTDSRLLDEWQLEKKRQAEGKSQPLDIAKFHQAVLDLELAEKQKRTLRRLKRQATSILNAIESV